LFTKNSSSQASIRASAELAASLLVRSTKSALLSDRIPDLSVSKRSQDQFGRPLLVFILGDRFCPAAAAIEVRSNGRHFEKHDLAYNALKAVGVDSGIRLEEEVWKMLFFRQHHGHSRTVAVEKPHNDVKNDAHYI
jgi:hypothetical protein